MERRYLVAALAIVATFAVFSRGFRSLEQLATQRAEHRGAMAKASCGANAAARAMAKLRTHLRPAYPEEAQLLAEMNVPFAGLEQRSQEMARQNLAASQCAREQLKRDTERLRRESARMRENMAHSAASVRLAPMALRVELPSDLEQRIEIRNEALAGRVAAANVKMQIAAARLQDPSVWIASSAPTAVEVDVPDAYAPDVSSNVTTHVKCKVKAVVHSQVQVQQAVRDAMRQWQYGYTSK
jgi:hypothetical protein